MFHQVVYHGIFTVFTILFILFFFKYLYIVVVVLLWSTTGTTVFMESGLVNILNVVLFFFSSKCSLLHNFNVFGSCIIHILYTGVLKLKKK